MANTRIITPTAFDAAHYGAVCSLLAQLTTRSIAFTPDNYAGLVTSDNSKLFLMLNDDEVVGMLTLGMYASPTGTKAWIEDVVVDTSMRGCGLGRKLVQHAIDYGKERGIDTVYLTSNPKRVAANALYQSLGFERKETNMYKMNLNE